MSVSGRPSPGVKKKLLEVKSTDSALDADADYALLLTPDLGTRAAEIQERNDLSMKHGNFLAAGQMTTAVFNVGPCLT